MERKAYPDDIGDGEWTFAAPCLTLPSEEALQRGHALQEALNGRRHIACSGALATTKHGAQLSMPSYDAVLKLSR